MRNGIVEQGNGSSGAGDLVPGTGLVDGLDGLGVLAELEQGERRVGVSRPDKATPEIERVLDGVEIRGGTELVDGSEDKKLVRYSFLHSAERRR